MENITPGAVARPVSAPLSLSVAVARPTVVTGPVKNESGQDSRGGDSQGRSWEQADAKRALTFQDALLSSTTLSSLREALDRLGGDRQATTENRSVSRKSAKDSDQSETATAFSLPQGKESGDNPRTIAQSRSSDHQSEADSNGGDGYYGPDWGASGQLLDASRRAVAIYQQSIATTPDAPLVARAEVLDMVA